MVSSVVRQELFLQKFFVVLRTCSCVGSFRYQHCDARSEPDFWLALIALWNFCFMHIVIKCRCTMLRA